MAGSILSSSITGIIAANESLNTLASKIALMFSSAVFQNFSDDESGAMILIPRVSATPPPSVVDDFWSDTASVTLRVYNGPGGSERWNPQAIGMTVANATGSTRVAGDVVGFNAGPGDLQYNADSSSRIAGVVGESTAVPPAFGLLRMSGRAVVKVNGAVARGDFLAKRGVGGSNEAVSGGATLDGSFGIALTAFAGPGSGTVVAYLWPYNSTT